MSRDSDIERLSEQSYGSYSFPIRTRDSRGCRSFKRTIKVSRFSARDFFAVLVNSASRGVKMKLELVSKPNWFLDLLLGALTGTSDKMEQTLPEAPNVIPVKSGATISLLAEKVAGPYPINFRIKCCGRKTYMATVFFSKASYDRLEESCRRDPRNYLRFSFSQCVEDPEPGTVVDLQSYCPRHGIVCATLRLI